MNGTNGDEEPLTGNCGIALASDLGIDLDGGSVFSDLHASDFCLRHTHHSLQGFMTVFLIHLQEWDVVLILP